MTRDTPFDDEITTADEFEQALGQLLSAAVHNDIDPRGSWEYRDGALPTHLEVMVIELEKREETE